MKIQQAAAEFLKARQHYERAFREFFASQVNELPEDRFWELQAVFRTEVCRFRFGYGRTNGIEQAAQEFCRKPLANDFDEGPRYSMEEAIRFAKSWQGWRRKLYQPLFDVVQNRGDDAYGDLLDALPLADRDVVQEAVAGEFDNQQQFEAAVLVGCDGSQQLSRLILHGENYVGMSLEDAARKFYAASLAENANG